MEPLKYIYSTAFITQLEDEISSFFPQFDHEGFRKAVFAEPWTDLELKQRMSRIADSLIAYLPDEVESRTQLLENLCAYKVKNQAGMNFEYMFIPEIIEKTCLENPHRAFEAFEKITVFTSCEFAVRIFIIQYPELSMEKMAAMANSELEAVRRFSSEGCRPRLPWARSLNHFQHNPEPIWPILHGLLDDPSEFVRRSVSNNLNDISKDHPQLVLEFAQAAWNDSENRKKLLKHALRTLLKKGNRDALSLLGIREAEIDIHDFEMDPLVQTGKYLSFNFKLANREKNPVAVRLEYAVHFKLNNGNHYKKVFKISERELGPQHVISVLKKHSFKPITTRKYYSGEHFISIIVNGTECLKASFLLED